jgi:hypothetical protein
MTVTQSRRAIKTVSEKPHQAKTRKPHLSIIEAPAPPEASSPEAAVRSMVIRAVARFEESAATLNEVIEGFSEDSRGWQKAFALARIDFHQSEERLAYMISASFNVLVPESMRVDEEGPESIGIGFRVDGRSYFLRDVVGNMVSGIIGVSDAKSIIDL